MATMTAPTFSTVRAAELAGITYRQADYWARGGLIWPTVADAEGSGSRRLYTLRDVMMLRAFAYLIQPGGHRTDAAADKIRAMTDLELRSAVSFEADKRTTITIALYVDQRTELDLWELVTVGRFGS